MGIAAVELNVFLGSSDEERRRLGEAVQSGKIHVTAIDEVEGSSFEQEFIEQIHIVDSAPSHINTGGNATANIQQSMDLDGTFAPAKLRPREQGQAQIDRSGVQGVHGFGQFQTERFVAIELTGRANQALGEVGEDSPIALFVGIGQSAARHFATESHVVQLGVLSPQASLDVTKTFTVGELRKS